MAYKVGDVIYRRTELGTAGYPGDACLRTCEEIMSVESGWNEEKFQENHEEISPFPNPGISEHTPS
jgi:glycerol-3-phosphate dehydrogenase